jgi:hypothetical protein
MLVCCNLTQETGKDSPVDGPAIFDHLVGLGLLEKGASLVAAHVERYPVPETTDREPPDSIRVLRTYDLGVELERHAERWKPLLPR